MLLLLIRKSDGNETHLMINVPILFDLLFLEVGEGCEEEAIEDIAFFNYSNCLSILIFPNIRDRGSLLRNYK